MWIDELDPRRAISNLVQEKTGDWYRDPWDWPEYSFLRTRDGLDLLRSRLASNALVGMPAAIDVPKENFGIRPAVILGVGDRVVYQTLVDALGPSLIGDLLPDVYGWRLPPGRRIQGRYARQDYQWRDYRSKLSGMADLFEYGLKTDIGSFFASLDPEQVTSQISAVGADHRTVDRLTRMLLGWKIHNPRPGLPQRSTASAILANMMLRDADAVLRDVAAPVPIIFNKPGKRYSFARWMDDMWLFGNDDGDLRSGQVDLQLALKPLGLVLNSAKTKLFQGAELVEATKKLQSSAIDDALNETPIDPTPLETLVDQVFDEREMVDRSTVRFISSRMRDHRVKYRVDDLLEVAVRLPHAADHLSRLFRQHVPSSKMQDWFLDYEASSWSRFEWSTAQFATAIGPARAPRRSIRDLFADFLERSEVSVPLAAVAAQRLAEWDRVLALDLIEQRIRDEASPQIARVLCLAAIQAGASPRRVRKWLALHEENNFTMRAMEWRSFTPPRIASDYR